MFAAQRTRAPGSHYLVCFWLLPNVHLPAWLLVSTLLVDNYLTAESLMREVSVEEGVAAALDSIFADRLAALLGAGLSMAPPSSLPSAAKIAERAKEKYASKFGGTRPTLADDVEKQAEFFFGKGELATVYFRALIDFHTFAGPPNAGHSAVADLLITRALRLVVTTNVDFLIETAGLLLRGQIAAGVAPAVVTGLPQSSSPLLKIHGCRERDFDNMVWARGQLDAEPVKTRITDSAGWLSPNLVDKDLLVVGFWTDWDYLNDVLDRVLGAARPAKMIVVNPDSPSNLEKKAHVLWGIGERDGVDLILVRAPGDKFLDRLRVVFSEMFVRALLHLGLREFETLGGQVSAGDGEPPKLNSDEFWQLRRDLEGCAPFEPAKLREAPNEPTLGLTLVQLKRAGATNEGAYWVLNGRRIRVLRTANTMLHSVTAAHAMDMAPLVAPDVVIAVGAESGNLPPNIARPEATSSVVRGGTTRWMTRSDAVTEFGL